MSSRFPASAGSAQLVGLRRAVLPDGQQSAEVTQVTAFSPGALSGALVPLARLHPIRRSASRLRPTAQQSLARHK